MSSEHSRQAVGVYDSKAAPRVPLALPQCPAGTTTTSPLAGGFLTRGRGTGASPAPRLRLLSPEVWAPDKVSGTCQDSLLHR